MLLYKLTDNNYCTKFNTKWGKNVTHITPYDGKLGTTGCLHAYKTPLHADIFSCLHNISNDFLWLAEGNVIDFDNTKVGCNKLTTLKIVPFTRMSQEQRLKMLKRFLWHQEIITTKDYIKDKFKLIGGNTFLRRQYNFAVKNYREEKPVDYFVAKGLGQYGGDINALI